MTALRRFCTFSRFFIRSYAVENATCARCRSSVGPCDVCMPFDDFLRRQAAAGDALDRRLEHLPVVGQLLRDRRMAGADDAEHVAVVNQDAQHLLDQLARPRRLAELQVEVVDEDQEDAAGRVVGRPALRQDDAFLHRRRRRRQQVEHAAAVRQHERHDLLLDAVLVDLEFARP